MDIDLARRFLKRYAGGNTLDAGTIRELYLSGYIAIDLVAVEKKLIPTAITEKGKRVLKAHSSWFGFYCAKLRHDLRAI